MAHENPLYIEVVCLQCHFKQDVTFGRCGHLLFKCIIQYCLVKFVVQQSHHVLSSEVFVVMTSFSTGWLVYDLID